MITHITRKQTKRAKELARIQNLANGIIPSKRRRKLNPSRNLSTSNGELEVIKFLMSNNILFMREKYLKGCKNPITGNKLFFDFYLPYKDTVIEFDGEQHFKPVFEFHKYNAEDALKKQQSRDMMKNNYCKQNSIKIIRISYLQIKEVASILTKELNS